jgi:hypothetical protein
MRILRVEIGSEKIRLAAKVGPRFLKGQNTSPNGAVRTGLVSDMGLEYAEELVVVFACNSESKLKP